MAAPCTCSLYIVRNCYLLHVTVSPSVETAEPPVLGTIALVDALEIFEHMSVASTCSSSLQLLKSSFITGRAKPWGSCQQATHR